MYLIITIIKDTSNKKDWFWLKQYLLPSLIWHPNQNENELKLNDNYNDKEIENKKDIKLLLFNEILIMVENETN